MTITLNLVTLILLVVVAGLACFFLMAIAYGRGLRAGQEAVTDLVERIADDAARGVRRDIADYESMLARQISEHIRAKSFLRDEVKRTH